ncbi:hypothetical protein L3C95_09465 [Chitinophaga filiformis]|uniref:hypothetical protein n=1 Tax=Chitinophaga filiformis TaxID=104663 RepID=UPI001F196EE4|nr:hypothetical protein [Chitinophaga filiformis]MCF6403101.1 hypothetical protein [Chitinophaga filiformis]
MESIPSSPDTTRLDHLIQYLPKAHKANDLKALGKLVEYARAHGVFYPDFADKHAIAFNLLLNISLDLLRSPLVHQSDEIWWFIAECYDIHFHQIQLDEYPPETARLFFELTRNVLHPDLHKLDREDSKISWYSPCIYFIKRASGSFSSRPDEFFELYTLLQPWIREAGEDHLVMYWVEEYEELRSGTAD